MPRTPARGLGVGLLRDKLFATHLGKTYVCFRSKVSKIETGTSIHGDRIVTIFYCGVSTELIVVTMSQLAVFLLVITAPQRPNAPPITRVKVRTVYEKDKDQTMDKEFEYFHCNLSLEKRTILVSMENKY